MIRKNVREATAVVAVPTKKVAKKRASEKRLVTCNWNGNIIAETNRETVNE
jgi:uncharacterized protein (DUF427 family)